MALNIKDPEADRLVRELASTTGETITEAARTAFAERLDRVRVQNVSSADRARVRDIIERARQRTPADRRSEAEILGLDDAGIPAA